MTSPYVIGLTGGIGSGKSTLSSEARKNGFPVFDVDDEADQIWQNEDFLNEVAAKYGDLGFTPKINIAKRIASNPKILDELYSIMEHRLKDRFTNFVLSNRESPVLVLDAPLLIEKEWDEFCDGVIVIVVPQDIRYERVRKRPGMTFEKFNSIVSKQLSDEQRIEKATDIIHGTKPIDVVVERFLDILRAYE